MRPASIVNFERLYLGALVLGLVNSFMAWDRTLAVIQSQVRAVGAADMGSTFLAGAVAISTLVTLLLWYFITRRASVVAKWIVTLLFAFNLAMFLRALARGDTIDGLTEVIGLVAMLLSAAAVWMLFRPDAKAWFAERGAGAG